MTAEEYRHEHKRLKELTHRNLMSLIESELNLAGTMSDLAQTEVSLGDEPHARALLTKVREALDSVRQHMNDNRLSDDEKSEVEDRLQELSGKLDAAKREVIGGSSSGRPNGA